MALLAWWHGGQMAHASAQPSTRPAAVAVVELFTSQGCSSCPPAEKVLGELADAAARDGRPIFTLAFHVDYWNRLGWADPFSDAAYSQRQNEYAKAFRSEEIYTPQVVVNGRTQFVGSDRDAADRAIAEALAAPAKVAVKVAVDPKSQRGYNIHVALTGAKSDAVVNVAVVEQGLATDVKSGENGGRRLEQPSVVRWFTTVPAANAGDVDMPALPGVRSDHASVVVYVQQPGNGAVLGAAAASLP
jgi:hypothetical protein